MERLDFIDYAKGIAILLVVIGHLLQYNFVGTPAKELFDVIYSFHMPLFMFLSGYVASLTIDKQLTDKGLFVKKKAFSLLVPFVFMGGVNLLLYKHLSIKFVVDLFRNPDNGLWFLIVLFCIQVWFLAMQYVCSKFHFSKRYMIEGAVGMIFITMIFVLNKVNHMCSGLYTNHIYYILFFLGSCSAKYLMSLLKNDIVLLLSIIGFIVFVPKFHMWQHNSSFLILSISLYASIVVLRVGMAMENAEAKSKRLLTFGKSSLAIYVIHFYFVKILNVVRIDSSDMALLPLFVTLGIVACFIGCICVQISRVISQNCLLNFLVLGRKK